MTKKTPATEANKSFTKPFRVTDEVIENLLESGESPGMPQDQANKVLASFYCFAIDNECGLTALITPIRHFEKTGACSDQTGPIGRVLDKCAEASELTWEFFDPAIKTPADAASYLKKVGISWNKDFQDWIDPSLTKELEAWAQSAAKAPAARRNDPKI